MALKKVKFLGKEYSVSDYLPVLVPILLQFEGYKEKLMDILIGQIQKDEYAGGADEDFKFWSVPIKAIAKEIIVKASSIGIYDLTESDLVDNNPGYKDLRKVCQETIRRMIESLGQSINDWIDDYNRAYSSATSKITGSGVSIWTNRLSSALLYSVMEGNVIRQQAREADEQFGESLKQISARNKNKREREEDEIKTRVYYPGCKDSINAIVAYMMDIYLSKLDDMGIISIKELSDYDLNKSSEIMKNLDLVDQKKEVLGKAFEKCPYNTQIFTYALNAKFLDDDSARYISWAELDGVIEEFIDGEVGVITLKTVNTLLKRWKYYFHVSAVMHDQEDDEYVREKLLDLRNQLVDNYDELKTIMASDDACRVFCKKNIETETDIRPVVISFVNEIVTEVNLNCLLGIYGEKTVLEEISPVEKNLENLNEINEYYINQITERLVPFVKQRIIEKKEEDDKAREKEEKRQRKAEIRLLRARKRKIRKAIILASIIGSIIITIIVLGIILPNGFIREKIEYNQMVVKYGTPFGGLWVRATEDDLNEIMGEADSIGGNRVNATYYYEDYSLFGVEGRLEVDVASDCVRSMEYTPGFGTSREEKERLNRYICYYFDHYYAFWKKEGESSKEHYWRTDDGIVAVIKYYYQNGPVLSEITIYDWHHD